MLVLGLNIIVIISGLGLSLESELGSGLEMSRVRNAWVRIG